MAAVGEEGHGMTKFHARVHGVEGGKRLVGAECEILGEGTQN